jgi:thioredoxin 2
MTTIACANCGTANRVPIARLFQGPKCGNCKESLKLQAPVTIATSEELQAVTTGSPVPVLVDFWAAWCAPCRMVAPELEKLAYERSGELIVAKLNTEEVPNEAARLGIRAIPTLVLFRDGREVQRESGAMPAAAIKQRFRL